MSKVVGCRYKGRMAMVQSIHENLKTRGCGESCQLTRIQVVTANFISGGQLQPYCIRMIKI